MWGCDFGTMVGGWWGGLFSGGLLSLLVWGLLIFLIVCLAIRISRAQKHKLHGPSQDRGDSEAILKIRFARGEISSEELVKMKQILSQPLK